MKPVKKIRIIEEEYWFCGIDVEGHFHVTESAAIKCIAEQNAIKLKTKISVATLSIYKDKYGDVINFPIDTIYVMLSNRASNCIKNIISSNLYNLETIGEFQDIPNKKLLLFQGLGKTVLLEIRTAISELIMTCEQSYRCSCCNELKSNDNVVKRIWDISEAGTRNEVFVHICKECNKLIDDSEYSDVLSFTEAHQL